MGVYEEVVQSTAEALIQASTTFRTDQIEAYHRAIALEKNVHAKWILGKIISNAEIAKEQRVPLCDDTGVPHVLIEVGDKAEIPKGFFQAIDGGIKKGLRELPGRPMAVCGDDLSRISQSCGLFEDSGALTMAPPQIKRLPGDKITLTVLMLGGGPEIRGKTLPVFHQHSYDVVIKEMISWGTESSMLLGCQPCILAYGIGRTHLEAASLCLEAMAKGDLSKQSKTEKLIKDEINKEGIGPLGMGGSCTVLGVFVNIGPQRASGVRIISLRAGCCFDPRRATVTFCFN
jgi:fumarate hydratase subunit alpha